MLKMMMTAAAAGVLLMLNGCQKESSAELTNEGVTVPRTAVIDPYMPLTERLTPRPASMTLNDGAFRLTSTVNVTYFSRDPQLAPLAARVAQRLGLKSQAVEAGDRDAMATNPYPLHLSISNDLSDEAYELQVDAECGISITGGSVRAVNWGVQTFYQLLPPNYFARLNTPQAPVPVLDVEIPACAITDRPRFSYRGLHVDVCRHFFTVEQMKEILNVMEAYKLNTLHWHLTDDQGWRIEIKKYPKLSEVSTKRRSTPQAGNRDGDDNVPYGPYIYTQDQIRDVVAYAAERGINIIPEIEMPGHAQAALAAYPDIGCTGGPYEVWTRWGVSDNVFCAGNEKTYEFLRGVIDEVVELFPYSYIHIGGDECPKEKWQVCPKCRAKARELGLSRVGDLQGYLVTRMAEYIETKGKHVIGWDELLEDGQIPKQTMIMAWRGSDYGKIAARRGHKAVMTPTSHLYLDYAQSKLQSEPESIGGFVPIEQVYSFNPCANMPPEMEKAIAGAQGNCWSEYFFDYARLQYAILPRLTALAELTWTPQEARDLKKFMATLPLNLLRFDCAKVNYRAVALELPEQILFKDSVDVVLSVHPQIKLFLTEDGSQPTEKDRYTGDAKRTFTKDVHLTYYTQMPSGKKSPIMHCHVRKLTEQAAVTLPAQTEPGLLYQTVPGNFRCCADFQPKDGAWKTTARLAQVGSEPYNMIGYIFKGYVYFEGGEYTFTNVSDDGSILWIDGVSIINNDGLHGPAETVRGKALLQEGYHAIEVKYFDAGGGAVLRYNYSHNGGAYQPLADAKFVHAK